VDLGGKARLALSLTEFTDDFGSRAFGPLLLRDRVVGACELCRVAVAAWVDAVTLDLTAMAGIASPLDGGGRHAETIVNGCRQPESLLATETAGRKDTRRAQVQCRFPRCVVSSKYTSRLSLLIWSQAVVLAHVDDVNDQGQFEPGKPAGMLNRPVVEAKPKGVFSSNNEGGVKSESRRSERLIMVKSIGGRR